MENKVYIIFVVVLAIAESKIPNYIQICKRSNPDVNNCIKQSVMALVPYLVKGIPELQVPSIEPFQIKDVDLSSSSGALYINAVLKQILAKKGSHFEILDLKTDTINNRFEFEVRMPLIQMTGNYEVDAKILALKLSGKGPFNLNVTECRFKCILNGNLKTIDDHTFITFDRIKLNITIGGAQVLLQDLFHGDPILGSATNAAINDNIDVFYDAMKPIFENTIEEIFTNIANKITETFDYNEIFPL